MFAAALALMLACFLVGVIAFAKSSTYVSRMEAEINSAPSANVSIPAFAFGKFRLVRSEYARLFPDGELSRKLKINLLVAATSWVAMAALLFSLDYLR